MRHAAHIAAVLILVAARAEAQELAGTFDQLRVLVKTGDTVTVVDNAGQRVRGKVSGLSNSALDLTVSGKSRQFFDTDIDTIEKRGSDPLRNGALTGFAIGGLLGVAAALGLADGGDNAAAYVAVAALMYGGIGAGIGTGVDALIEGRRVIYARSTRRGARLSIAPVLSGQRKGVLVRLAFHAGAHGGGRGPAR